MHGYICYYRYFLIVSHFAGNVKSWNTDKPHVQLLFLFIYFVWGGGGVDGVPRPPISLARQLHDPFVNQEYDTFYKQLNGLNPINIHTDGGSISTP